jgi:hypothetical protein
VNQHVVCDERRWSGKAVERDPEHPQEVEPALTLFWHTVESVHLADDASLSMTFNDDVQLFVPRLKPHIYNPFTAVWCNKRPAGTSISRLTDRS